MTSRSCWRASRPSNPLPHHLPPRVRGRARMRRAAPPTPPQPALPPAPEPEPPPMTTEEPTLLQALADLLLEALAQPTPGRKTKAATMEAADEPEDRA